MPRRVAVPSGLEQAAHVFLHQRDRAAEAGTARDDARDQIKDWLTHTNAAGRFTNGEEDANGNRILPFTVAGKRIIAQRRVPTPTIDLDAAEKLLREKGGDALYDVVFKRQVVRTFDEDELFRLNQQGVITDDELDALEVTGDPSYALVVADA